MQLVKSDSYRIEVRDFKVIGLEPATFKVKGYVNSQGHCELVEFYINVAGFWRAYHAEPFKGATNIYKKEFSIETENNFA